MTTNKEWLFSLPLEEQLAWMESEHYEPNPDCSAMLYRMYTENMKHEPCSDYEPERETERDGDSRERLEADAFAYLQTAYITYPQIIELLDRQAAITDREWEAEQSYLNAGYKEQIVELTAERDTLQGALDIAVQNESKLEAECDELKFDISLVRKNRDKYRSKFGKCLDYADAIHALMDDEGIA